MREIDTSEVHRDLDAKFKIGGLEAFDLIIALFLGAIMNLFVGGTALEIPLVIGLPVFVTCGLYFGKKGKPENFMIHMIRFYLSPGFFSSGEEPQGAIRKKIYE